MKALIIKTGHTETFVNENCGDVVSLGDVLRSSVILHLLSNYKVTWITSKEAIGLLRSLHQITHLTDDVNEVQESHFDLIINLERNEASFKAIQSIKADKTYGFIKKNEQIYMATSSSTVLFDKWLMASISQNLNWSEKLYSLLDQKWSGQRYLLGPVIQRSESSGKTKIGLNWKVGPKWPEKAWPMDNWRQLESTLNSNYEISWQIGFDDLNEYINWINSCDFIITHDSLGLHLSLALNKPLIALFGPTAIDEIDLYDLGHALKIDSINANQVASLICEKVG